MGGCAQDICKYHAILYKGLERPRIVVSLRGSGTNPPQIQGMTVLTEYLPDAPLGAGRCALLPRGEPAASCTSFLLFGSKASSTSHVPITAPHLTPKPVSPTLFIFLNDFSNYLAVSPEAAGYSRHLSHLPHLIRCQVVSFLF